MTTTTPDVVLLGGVSGGLSFVPLSTPLLRLNYYDGKFLRADDLTLEQRAHRAYMQHSNRAGGPGVVYGFNVSDAKPGQLTVTEGLAVDPMGRLLLLPQAIDAPIATLVEEARRQKAAVPASSTAGGDFAECEWVATAPVAPAVTSVDLHLVCIAHAEALCGHEEVFGRLCDEACVTATDRPYRHEGVVVLLVPLVLHNPLPTSSTVPLTDAHLRSRVASAYFADEWDGGGSLLSATGLLSPAWCLGAPPLLGEVVPLAVLGWKASTVTLLDMWTARRERMETPPRRYWQGRMEMRPWPVFLAQVLQFQCQLRKALSATPVDGGGQDDPCADERALLDKSTLLVDSLLKDLSGLQPLDEVDGTVIAPLIDTELVAAWKKQVLDLLTGKKPSTTPARVLVDGGIVELPAAGYLPVDAKSARSLQVQVQDLMGPGVDLRFCAVRRDQIAHELERAQHMDRISLLRGIDDETDREKVDILVPDGNVTTIKTTPDLSFALDFTLGVPATESPADTTFAFPSFGWDALLPGATGAEADRAVLDNANEAAAADPGLAPIRGAARLELGDGGSVTLRMAGAGAVGTAGARLIRTILAAPDGDMGTTAAAIARLPFDAAPEGTAELVRATAELLAARMAGMARPTGTRTGRVERQPVASLDEDPETQVAAVWATFWVATNPFTVKPGQSTAFSLSLDLFVPAKPSRLLEARLDGRLEVVKASRQAGADMIEVDARGFVELLPRNVSGAQRVQQFFTVPLRLGHGRRQGKDVVFLAIKDDDAFAGAGFSEWGGIPIVFSGSFGQVDSTGSFADPLHLPLTRFVSTKAMQDATLSQADNPHRKTAVDALTILQGMRQYDPSFFETAMRQLFPATGAGTVEIQPTTDWVLFRRRRREDCADAVAPPVDLVDVVAWVATSTDRKTAQDWVEMVRNGKGGEVPWKRVGAVQYEADGTELKSMASSLRNNYKLQEGGQDLLFAGYAENGSGPAVAIGRTDAVVAALEPAAVLATDGAVDTVDDPPAGKLEAGTVASIFLVSHRPACIQVFVVDLSEEKEDDIKTIDDALSRGDSGRLRAYARVLGRGHEVLFADGFVEEPANAVIAADIDRLRHDDLNISVVGWLPAVWPDEEKSRGKERLVALMEQLDLEGDDVREARFPLDGCPLRLYVLAREH